ncbi:hypothetical protein RHMOL_Rhmol05G0203500 [Rhododendron molle]|uniref:Uncharacterized protein n=1 Tax=Rhododendron molle TaxID=49168 RepID=A0ACC0NSB7_RHOML|nr:hypothetical protein RHMOL_Rhmol05G0203500 [Rhododendron molle]
MECCSFLMCHGLAFFGSTMTYMFGRLYCCLTLGDDTLLLFFFLFVCYFVALLRLALA